MACLLHNVDVIDLKQLTSSEVGYYVLKKREYLFGTSCKGKCAKLISDIYQQQNITIHSCLLYILTVLITTVLMCMLSVVHDFLVMTVILVQGNRVNSNL